MRASYCDGTAWLCLLVSSCHCLKVRISPDEIYSCGVPKKKKNKREKNMALVVSIKQQQLITDFHKVVNYTASGVAAAKQAWVILRAVIKNMKIHNQCFLNARSGPPPRLHCLQIESRAIKVKSDCATHTRQGQMNLCCLVPWEA